MTVAEHLNKTFPATVLASHDDKKSEQEVISIAPENLCAVVKILKIELGFNMLIDAFVLDWLGKRESRFEMNYLFYNTAENTRLQIRTALADSNKPKIDSITEFYPAADWAEREAYDMMGIHFDNHPNLKRLLMWENFEGYPLRKDYPLNKRQPVPTVEELL